MPQPAPQSPSEEQARPPNRRVRVFVSSTFRDMAEERDELMSRVWPELRRFCRERQVEFTEVDLRWGISEKQSSRRETLKLCLDEVGACRPFFVALLGERYGWVPGSDSFGPDLEEEQPWAAPLRDRSVTELEILHGVLNDPTMAHRAFFYFRDPAYAAGRGAGFLPESPEAAARQSALKERIRAACRERGIPLRETYAAPGDLAAMVLADLRAAVDADFPVESMPGPLELEAREHDAYARALCRVHVGRDGALAVLDRHAQERGGPLVVVGEPGSGKSALLANWVSARRRAHPHDWVFLHHVGATPGSTAHWGLLGRLLAEIKEWTGDPAEVPVTHDALLRDLPAWLARLRAAAERRGVRAIVVLDALDRLDDRDGARLLGWLPDAPFAGALRLIVSTLPGESLDALGHRGWPVLGVEPLAVDERRRLVGAYLARFSKRLDKPRLERLARAPAAANPLYLRLLLDELRVTGTHERLDERLDAYLEAPDVPALLDQILARWEQAYERDRPGLVGEALALLWAARRGLSEPELLALLRPHGLPSLPPALWAPLRAALDESLVDRSGILGPAHEFLRNAVERRYAPAEDLQRALRLRLASFFEEQPVSARACDELPWLLRRAGERGRLRACLVDVDRFLLIHRRDPHELLGDWLWVGEAQAMGRHYREAFEAWQRGTRPTPDRVALAANQVGLFLEAAGLYGEAEPFCRRALEAWQKEQGESGHGTATALNNLGMLLRERGAPAEARALLERALAVRRRVLGENHPDTAISLQNLAQVLQDQGDLAAARPLLEQALAIWQEALGERHPDTATAHNNLGLLLLAMGNPAAARPLVQRALELRREVLGRGHPDTAISLNNLGALLQETGDLAGARPCYEEALAVQRETLGERHPDTAQSLGNLGSLLQAMGDLEGAQGCFEQALAILEGIHGGSHPDVAQKLNNLGTLLHDRGDFAAALPYLERALAAWQQVLGERHPRTGTAHNNVGMLRRAMGDLAGARPHLEQALAIARETLGERHPDTAQSHNNLAMLYHDLGDLDKARAYYERALAAWRALYGDDHPDTAACLNNLGIVCMDAGQPVRAVRYLHRALAARRRVLGERHPATAQCLNNLGVLMQNIGDRKAARPYLEQALATWQEVLGPRHPEVATSHNNLGVLLHAMRDLAGARRHLELALEIRREALGERHPETAITLSNLGLLLRDQGDRAGARRCLESALAIRREVLGESHPDTIRSRERLASLPPDQRGGRD